MIIRDLIEVPPVQTVIRFKDLADRTSRLTLLQQFVFTAETEHALRTVLGEVADGKGQGHFLIGNYGSGKSHFLTVLATLLEEPSARSLFPDMGALWEKLNGAPCLCVTISLVEHSSIASLEDIVTGALVEALQQKGADLNLAAPQSFVGAARDYLAKNRPQLLKEKEHVFQTGNLHEIMALARAGELPFSYRPNRQETFSLLEKAARDLGFHGLAIFVDELSEFLLSKPTSQSFNEDIRFLQYLGEAAPRIPAWIIAAVQEQIEQTGAIAADILKKIKDRYPVRLTLSATHVRDLIKRRLIVKKPGAKDSISPLYDRLASSFGRLPFSLEDFLDLYPVHPLTVSFLEGLSNLFSQHRGIVDFIHYQLRGDAQRRIPGMLGEPPESLLTAERIFDHFADRFQENPELSPYYEKVYRYFTGEADRLFPEENDAQTALKAVKLLLLACACPHKKELSLRELVYHLSESISSFDAQANFEYLRVLLTRMVKDGAYIAMTPGESPLEDVFSVDLEADVARLVRRETEYIKKGIFDGDSRLFTALGRRVSDPALPLADFLRNPRVPETCLWQNTTRKVMRVVEDLCQISPAGLEGIFSAAESGEESDAVLVMARAIATEQQKEYLEHLLLPHLKYLGRRANAVVFWLPRKLAQRECDDLSQALALILMEEKYARDDTPLGRKVRAHLGSLLEDKDLRVAEIFKKAYLEGEYILGSGEKLSGPGPLLPPFAAALRRLAGEALDRSFPAHFEIMPQTESFPPYLPERLMSALLQNGGDFAEKQLDPALKNALAYLLPLKVAKRIGRSYRLDLDQYKSPVLDLYLDLLDAEPVPLADVFKNMAQSEFGLDRNSFVLLSLALLAAGTIQAFKGGHRLSPYQITSTSAFWQIEGLVRGRLVSDQDWQAIGGLPFLPAGLCREKATFSAQEKAWEKTVEYKRRRVEEIKDLSSRIIELGKMPALAGLNGGGLGADIALVMQALGEIKVSYPSREGLEGLAQYLREHPDFVLAEERLKNCERFLREDLDTFLAMHSYLHAGGLRLMGEWERLAQAKEELEEKLTGWPELLHRDHFARVSALFNEFQKEYRDLYLAQHQARVGPQNFKAFEALKSSTGYRLLEKLGGIQGLNIEHDLVTVKRMLAKVLERRCLNENLAQDLLVSPACKCGFNPAGEEIRTSSTEIVRVLEKGLVEYLEALKSPLRLQKITGFLAALENAGKEHAAAPVRELLALDSGDFELLEKLKNCLTPACLEVLNRALAGQAPVVERNLDELYETLVDRSFTPEDLKSRIKQWLEKGPLPPDGFVKVLGIKHSTPQVKENPLEDQLSEYLTDFPELTPLYRELGFSSFSLVAAALAWLLDHDRQEGELSDLADITVSDEDTASLADFCERMFSSPSPASLAMVREAALQAQERGLKERFSRLTALVFPEITGQVTRERFFPFLFFPAFRRLLAHIEELADERKLTATARILERQAQEEAVFFSGREGISFAASLAAGLSALTGLKEKDPGMLCDARSWEKIYAERLGTLELNLAQAARNLQGLPLDPVFDLEKSAYETMEVLENYHGAFARYLAEGEKGLSLAGLLLKKRDELRRKTQALYLYHIFLDGLRFDLWEKLFPLLEQNVTGRTVSRGFTWAHLPTTTARQFEMLEEKGFDWPRVPAQELAAVRPQDLAELGREEQLIRFDFPDLKVHTAREDLPVLFQETAQAFLREVIPLVLRLPERSLCLFFTDHGFRSNTAYRPSDKFAAPRYTHGGDSPAEVLSPWSAYIKLK